MSSNEKPFILIDGSSYLYRAFHAMPAFSNVKGHPTGAIYGMLNMLRKLLNDIDPEMIAVVFDAKGKTFRDDMYADYKATRSAMPDDLAKQIAPIHAAIKALGLPILIVDGVEADDVIGTLAKEASEKKIKTLISTGDKDLAQLVNEYVTLVNTMTDSYLTPATVTEKFGIPPERIVDYLTLVGDSVDNIPGVPQVGPKTAVKWLQHYQSLDAIIQHADEIKGKVGDNLRASLPNLPLTKQLVTIKLDVSLPVTFERLKRQAPDVSELIKLYQEFEFKTWLAELLQHDSEKSAPKEKLSYTLLTEQTFPAFLQRLKENPIFSFNIEATQESYMNAELIGLSFSFKEGEAFYVSANDVALSLLKPVFENSQIKKIGYNFKYLIEVLANYNIKLAGIAFDVLLESYILDSTNANSINALALRHLGRDTIKLEDLAGKGAKQISLKQVDIEKTTTFACESADVILQLHKNLWQRFETEPGLKNIYNNIELPLCYVLASIERIGVYIDVEKLNLQTIELKKRVDELEQQAYQIANSSFNLNSPKQLQEILFDRLKLPVLQKTPTGQPSTADNVLQELALDYELPQIIIEYRSLTKLITTYTTRLPEQVNAHTGRVHTSYNQTGAATGRLSSSDPNLQNIPVKTAEGRKIRQAFVAPPGKKIISADYSQIELRIMAHISEDKRLLYAFANNLDVHKATAAEVLGLALEEVTLEQRRSAKAVNFGLMYGMSAFGLGRQINAGRQDAQAYIDRYFDRYPGVKDYMENTRKLARAQGYVETLEGRRLYLPEIKSSQIPRQKAAERAAINAPLQGTAADIIKKAMISIQHWLDSSKLDIKMIMQVHDELVFEVDEKQVDLAKQEITKHMMNAAALKVPLLVTVGSGDNWDEASLH